MATKRAWKLHEFVAHGSSVNCLALGHKSGRVMVTGGEDKKVNMWAVGKPNCIMSLSGHTSAVEAVRFNNAEEMVVAGSYSGALKIWDLEQAKIVRTLTGHKASIKSLDFHPYGDFTASGSIDSSIKLWDIRRKGCIFTYKGHTGGVNCLRFSPDGRWIASASEDGLMKLWDLTAGKLLNDFKLHTGPVTAVEFHPNEFLIASASSDRTVKFWDLETFQLVSTTDGESTGVRSIFFHPDGTCLYSGISDMLKVYGWEPSRCYDTIPMSWGGVADISIAHNQLIGAVFSQTNVSTYVVDITRVAPMGDSPSRSPQLPQKPISPPMTASGRRSYVCERPATQSTKQQPKEEEEDDLTPSDDVPNDISSMAEINNPDDYRELFQPKKTLSHSPPRKVEPFPAPPDDVSAHVTVVKANAGTTVVKANAGSTSVIKPAPSVQVKPFEPPSKSNRPAEPVQSAPKTANTKRGNSASKNHTPSQPPKSATKVVNSNKQDPSTLDVNEFLPKQSEINSEIGEGEKIDSILKGCESMSAVLGNRHKNLQLVHSIWSGGSMKTALDTAVRLNDKAIVIDLLNSLITTPGTWNLDLCNAFLPQILDLVNSKYDHYVQTACTALKLVLKNFGTLIKGNITAPPPIGVDISREERHSKCKACYKVLMDIRSAISQKVASSHSSKDKNSNLYKELLLHLAQLD